MSAHRVITRVTGMRPAGMRVGGVRGVDVEGTSLRMSNPIAGWYPDPQNPVSQRYWDGAVWTEQTRPVAPSSPVPPPPFAGSVSTSGAGRKPDNYLVWSILSTVCCCVPVGIFAIVNAAKVDGAWGRGDVAAAVKYSSDAKKFSIIAAVLGVAVNVVVVGLQALFAFSGA